MLYIAEVTVETTNYMSAPQIKICKHTVEAKDLDDAEWKINNYYAEKCISYAITYSVLNIEFFIHID